MSLTRIVLITLLVGPGMLAEPRTGTVVGVVYDGQTGRPITGATFSINGQTSDRSVTDSDGRFTISLAPGTYTLHFTAPNYTDVQVSDVVVKLGEVTEASTVMSNSGVVTTVDVTAKVDAIGSTAAAALDERKLSATVSDSISREELAASASSDAAGALEKVTGVSVVGEGFVYVRGLGERYSATMLRSSPLPSLKSASFLSTCFLRA